MRYEDRIRLEQALACVLLQLFPWRKQIIEAYTKDTTQNLDVMPVERFWEWLAKLAPTANISSEQKQSLEQLYCSAETKTGIDTKKMITGKYSVQVTLEEVHCEADRSTTPDLEQYERDPSIDPEMQYATLPQPYRMIVKVLEEDIVEAAWDKIVQRMPRASASSSDGTTTLLPRISVGDKTSLLPEGELIADSCSAFSGRVTLLCTKTRELYVSNLSGHERLVQFEEAPVQLLAKEYVDQGIQLVALCFRLDEDPSSTAFVRTYALKHLFWSLVILDGLVRFYELRLTNAGDVSGSALTLLATVKASDVRDLSGWVLSDVSSAFRLIVEVTSEQVLGEFAMCLRTDETQTICTYSVDLLAHGDDEIDLTSCKLTTIKEYAVDEESNANATSFLHYLDGSTLVCAKAESLVISVVVLTAASHIEKEFNTPLKVTCLHPCNNGFIAVGMVDGSFFFYNCHTNYLRSFVRKCDTPVANFFFAEPFLLCAHASGDIFLFNTSLANRDEAKFDPKSDIEFIGKLEPQGSQGRLTSVVRFTGSPLAALALADNSKGVQTWRIELVDLESAGRLSFLYHSQESKDGEVLRPDDPVDDDGRWKDAYILTHMFNDTIVVGNGEYFRRFELSKVLAAAVKPLHSAYRMEQLEKYPFLSLVTYFYAQNPAQDRYRQETCTQVAKDFAMRKQQELSAGCLSRGSRSTGKKSISIHSRSRASTSLSQSIGSKSRSRLTSLASTAKLRVAQSLEGAISIDWPAHLDTSTIQQTVDAFEASRLRTMNKRERYLAWRLKELQANPAR